MGPERRANDRHRRTEHYRAILIAFWASVAISAIVSGGALFLAYKTNRAICVEVKFLEGSAKLTRLAAAQTPDANLRAERYKGADRADGLARDLRRLVIHC